MASLDLRVLEVAPGLAIVLYRSTGREFPHHAKQIAISPLYARLASAYHAEGCWGVVVVITYRL